MGLFNKKCVVLYSGGLDSLIAVHTMLSLGFSVYPLFIETPFYKKDREHLKKQLFQLTLNSNHSKLFDLKIVRDDKSYIEIVKNPEFGYGKNLNPCIDCKIFFFKQAKKFMEEIGATFVVTGEVLGQRPMSQRSYSILRSIEKRAGLSDLVLRPLSAKCLQKTKMEEEGIIDKEKLFCITGRSRKQQIELARKFGIISFEPPAGGCLLTDAAFALRVKDMLKYGYRSAHEIELLNIGRHFRINSKRFVVSRNQNESERLLSFAKDELPLLECLNAPGAVGIFIEKPNEYEMNIAASILKRYSKKAELIKYTYKGVNRIVKPLEMPYEKIDLLKIKSNIMR